MHVCNSNFKSWFGVTKLRLGRHGTQVEGHTRYPMDRFRKLLQADELSSRCDMMLFEILSAQRSVTPKAMPWRKTISASLTSRGIPSKPSAKQLLP